jgi:hypothetical protein
VLDVSRSATLGKARRLILPNRPAGRRPRRERTVRYGTT